MPVVPQENALPDTQFSASDRHLISPLIGDNSEAQTATNNLAGVTGKIADVEQKKANDAKLIDADAQLTNYKNDLLWNPQSGAYQQKGENALGVVETYGKRFQDKVSDLYGSMTNADQRDAFQQRSAQIGQDFNVDLEKHTFQENKNLEEQKYKIGQDAYMQDAILNYQTPGKVEDNLALTEGLVRNQADKNGITDPELIKTLVNDAKSKIHAGVIERASDHGQDQFAQQYFDANKEQLGDKLPAVEKTLVEATTLGNAQRLTQDAVSKGATQSEALAKVSDIEEPKVKAKARELINQYYEDQKKAQEQATQKLVDDSSRMIDQAKSYDAIPASTKAALPLKAKEELMTYAERVSKGIEPPPNGATFQMLTSAFADPNRRNEMANTDLNQYRNDLTNNEFKSFIDLQAKVDGKDKATSDLLDYQNANQKIMEDTLNKAGITSLPFYGSKIEVNDAPAYTRFQADYNTAINQKQAAIGRNLQPAEAEEIANQLATKMVTSKKGGFLGFGGTTSRQVSPLSPNETVKAEDIPQNIRSGLSQTLQAKGWPVTDENIVNFYLKGVQAGVIKPGGR